MTPYFLMLALPGIGALTGVRRATATLLLLALVYWLLIGFRYQVGMDWNNYIHQHQLYTSRSGVSLAETVFRTEPAFGILNWFAAEVWGGMILVHAVSALIFCWGFFTFAARCREPFLAVVVATPLLVVAFAMSGLRQAMAMGIVFYLFATWERRSMIGRIGFVLLASLFHFSAIFVLVFVALSGRMSTAAKTVSVVLVALLLIILVYLNPDVLGGYSELYVAGERKLEAPGAIGQFAAIALAAIVYFAMRGRWSEVNADSTLYRNLAIAALLAVPAIFISSVGTYRLALYLWPFSMHFWSGLPSAINGGKDRMLYRFMAILASVLLLWGWLTTANNAWAWIPYQNWLLLDGDPALLRR